MNEEKRKLLRKNIEELSSFLYTLEYDTNNELKNGFMLVSDILHTIEDLLDG